MTEVTAPTTCEPRPVRLTVTRREFAAMLGIGIATFDRIRDKLPATLDLGGRRVLWPRAEVLAFVDGKRA